MNNINDKSRKELLEKGKLLANLGINEDILQIILENNEEFLKTPLCNIVSNIESIKQKSKNANIAEIVEETPTILTCDNKQLVKKLNLIEKIVTKNDLEEIINYHSFILEYKYYYLKGLLRLLYINDLADRLLDIIVLDSEIFGIDIEEIDIEKIKEKI